MAKVMDLQLYDFKKREKYWQKFWEREKIYQFDPNSKKPPYTVDTPPPTVSGALHLGHVFSYTQAEVVVRYFRMAGYNVRYPLGYDNNGLPTERLTEKERGVLGRDLPLEKFTKLCLEVIEKYTKVFENLFFLLGFSFDWRLTYSTISAEVAKLAQTVFIKLYKKGLIYQKEAPALYCTECGTSVAQAEVEDREFETIFYDVAFRKEDRKELLISTTRPELIPACVSVFVHPDDKRYKNLVGKTITTPFGTKVKVLTDVKVQQDMGTGAVMCCTYGDETDVYWVKTHSLSEKIILTAAGKFEDIASLPQLKGKTIEEGRKLVVSKLKERKLIKKEEQIKHDVGVHERCGRPIEIINTTQWFVKILDKKRDLIAVGNKINWYPEYMQKRYLNWVENLKWDWSISRERFFGIPIPAYICQNCSGIILPAVAELPIDPRLKKFEPVCPKCGSSNITGEKKILDTWFTSALTPDINNYFPENGKLTGKMYPMSMRPQAHDIIRTWALYTIAMGLFRHRDVPWRDLMISGHILVKKRQKISKKTGGGKLTPEEIIKNHSADSVRYAMCGASLGQDAYFDDNEIQMGKKLVTKIFNASKFALANLSDFKLAKINKESLEPVDKWILASLRQTATKMAQQFQKYEIGKARQFFEDFFWALFCDNYLEIVKARLYGSKGVKRQSAQYTLYQTLLSILKMAAPFVPHITEEIYQNYFAEAEIVKSIHLTLWPKIEAKLDKKLEEGAALMLRIISQVRKHKSDKKVGLGTKIGIIGISCSDDKRLALEPFCQDIQGVTRAEKISFVKTQTKNITDFELLVSL